MRKTLKVGLKGDLGNNLFRSEPCNAFKEPFQGLYRGKNIRATFTSHRKQIWVTVNNNTEEKMEAHPEKCYKDLEGLRKVPKECQHPLLPKNGSFLFWFTGNRQWWWYSWSGQMGLSTWHIFNVLFMTVQFIDVTVKLDVQTFENICQYVLKSKKDLSFGKFLELFY